MLHDEGIAEHFLLFSHKASELKYKTNEFKLSESKVDNYSKLITSKAIIVQKNKNRKALIKINLPKVHDAVFAQHSIR